MAEDQTKPVIVAIVSAGSTAPLEEPARSLSLPLLSRADVGEASAGDIGLIHFVALLTGAWAKMNVRRPLGFVVRGGADTRARAVSAFAQAIATNPNVLVFWTFSPLALPGEPRGDDAFDDLLAQAAAGATKVVFPAATGFGARAPGMIGCGAAVAAAPHLDAVPAPQGWPDPAPDVTSWADWPSFRAAWLGAGMGEAVPEAVSFPAQLCLPVWSAAPYLALMESAQADRMTLAMAETALQTVSAAVSIRPQSQTPRLGFLDLRVTDSAAALGLMAMRGDHA